MIPDFDHEEYDPDNNTPEELLAVLIVAIPSFETARIELIVEGASKNYLKGTKIAYDRLGEKFVSSEVKDDVYNFLKIYKKQINEGYTIIQGEKVYWLRDRTLTERQKIFDIISSGVTEGKSPDKVKTEFQKYFSMQKTQAERIARTETAYVQERGIYDRYVKFGVKKVKWLLGSNPCEICTQYGGKIFDIDDLPYQIPVHPSCTCTIVPVLD